MLKKLIVENLYKWEKQSLAPPTQISITPTNLCNLKCQSCWQRDEGYQSQIKNRPNELSEQKLLDVIKESHELNIRCIEITGGGEPLARKNVTIKLIKEIKNKGMIGWMTSNGTLFSTDIIKLMIELEWDKLTISLDGPDAKTNDFLRPPLGTFEKIINVLSLFNKYKKLLNKDTPQITFNVVVSNYNIDKLSEIICLAGKHRVEGVTFEPIKNLSNQCKRLLVDFEKEYNKIMKELEKAETAASKNNIFTNIDGLMRTPELIKYSGKFLSRTPTDAVSERESKLLDIPCIEPWFHIYLEVDGNVRPCCVNVGLGENIYNKSLKDIWVGEKFSSFRSAIINKDYPLSCNQCNANLICFSREIQDLLKEKFATLERPFIKEQTETYQKQKQIKMLITDTAPLYPPLWGGPRRIWYLYSIFSKDLFDITYVGINPAFSKTLKYSFNRIADNFKEIQCAFPPHYYLWHAFERLIFKNTSLDLFVYLWMHTDWQFKYVLKSQNADIIICSHPWSSLCCHKNNDQLFIYDAHNCEYLLMDQILGSHPLKKFILRQVKKIEGDACQKSDLILACSEREKIDLINLYKIKPEKIVIINNGASVKERINKEESRKKLNIALNGDKVVIFIGAYYKPNINATGFIIEKIAPILTEFKFLIVGTVFDFFKKREIPKNVIFLGRVSEEQLELALSAADLAINPMFEGSGINIKMLDYMTYGLPIVTTQIGARGIETFGKCPMVTSLIADFADNIKMLVTDTKICNQMSEDGISLIAQRYDWKKISSELQNIIIERFKIN